MLENNEIWKDVKGYEGLYQVSNIGRIWSVNRQKYLKPYEGNGYLKIDLFAKNGKRKKEYIHRLVALAFIPNPENLPEVNHKDENKYNNCVNNLEWCTHQYNNKYGTKVERMIEKIEKPVYCIELDRIFESGKKAAEYLGMKSTNGIYGCCSNKYGYKTAYGYHWRWAYGEYTT